MVDGVAWLGNGMSEYVIIGVLELNILIRRDIRKMSSKLMHKYEWNWENVVEILLGEMTCSTAAQLLNYLVAY